jgi:hypothetical protein
MHLPPLAIPTYRRSQSIVVQTLAFLKSEQYPSHLITLFVANEEEKEAYLRDVPENLYHTIVVGVKGLAAQRNFISGWYEEGQILVQMDDDVSNVKTLGLSFLELVRRGVDVLELCGVGLWGVLPNDDGRRLKDSTTLHLTHILGSFFICRNHREFSLSISQKEDYLRSIWYFKKYGKVARYRGAGIKTSYNSGSGGLIQPGRQVEMQKEVEWMSKTYPTFCTAIVKKGMPDLRLNWRAMATEEVECNLGRNSFCSI